LGHKPDCWDTKARTVFPARAVAACTAGGRTEITIIPSAPRCGDLDVGPEPVGRDENIRRVAVRMPVIIPD
jgi:hypothetical protein